MVDETVTLTLKTGKVRVFEKAKFAVEGAFILIQIGAHIWGWESHEVKSFEVVKKSG